MPIDKEIVRDLEDELENKKLEIEQLKTLLYYQYVKNFSKPDTQKITVILNELKNCKEKINKLEKAKAEAEKKVVDVEKEKVKAEAETKAEAEARAKAEAKAEAEAETRAKAEAEAKAKAIEAETIKKKYVFFNIDYLKKTFDILWNENYLKKISYNIIKDAYSKFIINFLTEHKNDIYKNTDFMIFFLKFITLKYFYRKTPEDFFDYDDIKDIKLKQLIYVLLFLLSNYNNVTTPQNKEIFNLIFTKNNINERDIDDKNVTHIIMSFFIVYFEQLSIKYITTYNDGKYDFSQFDKIDFSQFEKHRNKIIDNTKKIIKYMEDNKPKTITGGQNYKQKYLKYKIKYEQLKKNKI